MGLVGLGLSKPIRDPTHPEDPIETDPKPIDPTIPMVNDGSSPLETDSGGSVSVSIPKTRTDQRKTQIPASKIPKFNKKKTQIHAIYHVDLVRF